ncbi:MAG: iron ABC transporter permease, partial [Actinomycetota bacterium]|nr:iron ABC transporter permease [Actinomycetota bacterium]
MNRLFGLSTRGVLVVVPAVFVAAFFLYPVATILWRGLGGGGGETFLDLAASSRQRDIAWFTIWQAIASTVLTLAVGLPAASVVARLSARRQRLVRALVTVPFVLPTVVVAGAFTEVFA